MDKLAVAVVSGKVKGVTSDIQKGLGLDEDKAEDKVGFRSPSLRIHSTKIVPP